MVLPTAPELARAAYGAWRLALFDPRGLDCFDNTVAAYWRSFQAAVVLIPAYAVLVSFRLARMPAEPDLAQFVLVEAIAYVINWTAFPLAMAYVCDRIGRSDRYLRYVAAHNWSVIVQIAALLGAMAVSAAFLGPGSGALLNFAAMAAVLVYQWFIARTALAVAGRAAAMIVGLDLAIGILLSAVAGRFA